MQAHAKMRLSETVELDDVEEAIRLLRVATQSAATDPRTGKIDMDLITTVKMQLPHLADLFLAISTAFGVVFGWVWVTCGFRGDAFVLVGLRCDECLFCRDANERRLCRDGNETLCICPSEQEDAISRHLSIANHSTSRDPHRGNRATRNPETCSTSPQGKSASSRQRMTELVRAVRESLGARGAGTISFQALMDSMVKGPGAEVSSQELHGALRQLVDDNFIKTVGTGYNMSIALASS
jgi:hypothetical protein